MRRVSGGWCERSSTVTSGIRLKSEDARIGRTMAPVVPRVASSVRGTVSWLPRVHWRGRAHAYPRRRAAGHVVLRRDACEQPVAKSIEIALDRRRRRTRRAVELRAHGGGASVNLAPGLESSPEATTGTRCQPMLRGTTTTEKPMETSRPSPRGTLFPRESALFRSPDARSRPSRC
jgi:hypothetical protein